jgi:hypothetical protein
MRQNATDPLPRSTSILRFSAMTLGADFSLSPVTKYFGAIDGSAAVGVGDSYFVGPLTRIILCHELVWLSRCLIRFECGRHSAMRVTISGSIHPDQVNPRESPSESCIDAKI